jgi:hypothetical protein
MLTHANAACSGPFAPGTIVRLRRWCLVFGDLVDDRMIGLHPCSVLILGWPEDLSESSTSIATFVAGDRILRSYMTLLRRAATVPGA